MEISVPPGATFREVVDTLQARGIVKRPGLFGVYARLKGLDRQVRAGTVFLPGPVTMVPGSEGPHRG